MKRPINLSRDGYELRLGCYPADPNQKKGLGAYRFRWTLSPLDDNHKGNSLGQGLPEPGDTFALTIGIQPARNYYPDSKWTLDLNCLEISAPISLGPGSINFTPLDGKLEIKPYAKIKVIRGANWTGTIAAALRDLLNGSGAPSNLKEAYSQEMARVTSIIDKGSAFQESILAPDLKPYIAAALGSASGSNLNQFMSVVDSN